MGTSTDAHCYACGFDCVIMIGGGMRNFRTFAAWPVRCARCPGIAATNLKKSPHTCLECEAAEIAFFEELVGGPAEALEWQRLKAANRYRSSVSAPAAGEPVDHLAQATALLEAGDAHEPVTSWDSHRLSKGRHACPDCGEPQLRFGTEFSHGPIMWD